MQLIQTEKSALAKRCEHPALDLQDRVFYLGFVFGLARARRQHGHAVVDREVCVSGILFRFVAARRLDPGFEVVGHENLGTPAKELEGKCVAVQPVAQSLAPAGPGEDEL